MCYSLIVFREKGSKRFAVHSDESLGRIIAHTNKHIHTYRKREWGEGVVVGRKYLKRDLNARAHTRPRCGQCLFKKKNNYLELKEVKTKSSVAFYITEKFGYLWRNVEL